MPAQFTRRQLAAAVAGSTALLAQTTQPPAPPLPANPEDELAAIRTQLRANSELLAKFDLPISTEPAAHFKA
jgi:hypothetical protein